MNTADRKEAWVPVRRTTQKKKTDKFAEFLAELRIYNEESKYGYEKRHETTR